MPRRNHVPTYRLHKQSGQAIVTLPDGFCNRRDVLLGTFGSAESRKEYARVLTEWESNGRRLPRPARSPAVPACNPVQRPIQLKPGTPRPLETRCPRRAMP
jgi:hypothetical protein